MLRRAGGVLVAVAIGTGGFVLPAAPAAAATESPRAWVKGLCTSVAEWSAGVDTTLSDASPDQSTDLRDAAAALTRTLNTVARRTDKLAKAIQRGGVPRVDGGKAAVADLVQTFTAVSDILRETRGALKAAPLDDPVAFATEVREASAELQSLLSEASFNFAELEFGGPVLEEAAAAAPQCRSFVGE